MRAMLLAAGRGERMRPLTDSVPKPLLMAGGKPLIVWQLERLVRAGFDDVVINVAYRGEQIVEALGDGARYGARITYSRESEPMETAGGIAHALPLLGDGSVVVAAADVYAEFDYRRLAARVDDLGDEAAIHLVLVPNPSFRPQGDYALELGTQPGRVGLNGFPRWTWSGIGVFPTRLLREIPSGKRIALLPFFAHWIARGLVRGELYRGVWDNLGTPKQLARLDVSLKQSPHHPREPDNPAPDVPEPG